MIEGEQEEIVEEEEEEEKRERDVFEELFTERKKKDLKKQEVEKQSLQISREMSNLKLAIEQTNNINNQLQQSCFNALFQVLDVNKNNMITYSSADNLNLQENVLKLIQPILQELQEHNESLTYDEFMLALHQIFRVFNVEEKRTLLSWYSNLQRQNSPRKLRANSSTSSHVSFSFQPNLTENTKTIYDRSNRISKDFIERNNILLNSKQQYQEQMLTLKNQEELQGNNRNNKNKNRDL